MTEMLNTNPERSLPKIYGKSILWHPASSIKILQVYNKGLEFALVSDKFEQCHPFVWCKDFLHDVIFSTIHQQKFDIYRFFYNPENNPNACLKEIRLLVTNSKDSKLPKKIDACIEFMNQIEESLGMPKTKVRKCLNAPQEYKYGVYLFQGNKRWLNAPPMISLYSFLIRIGLCHQIGTNYNTTINLIKNGFLKPYQPKDSKWLCDIEPSIYKIIRYSDKKIFYRDIKKNYPKHLLIDRIHNNLGIMSFSTDMRLKAAGQPVSFPYWHRFR